MRENEATGIFAGWSYRSAFPILCDLIRDNLLLVKNSIKDSSIRGIIALVTRKGVEKIPIKSKNGKCIIKFIVREKSVISNKNHDQFQKVRNISLVFGVDR
jgi:hypothetical protein